MSERDEELLGPLLRLLGRRQPGGNTRIGCPEDERLAAYLDGGLSEVARGEIEIHLADCQHCLDHFLAAESVAREGPTAAVPPKMLARAMALMAHSAPKGEILKLVVALVRESLEIISTSGRWVTPTLAAEVRGKAKTVNGGILRIEKDLGKLRVAVEIERLEGEYCQVAVHVAPVAGAVTDAYRLSLLSGVREQASFLTRQGSAIFDRIPPSEYQLAISEAGKSLGAIELTIKEAGRE